MRRNDLPTVTMPSLRTNRRTDPRQFGAFRNTFRKFPEHIDCVVGPGEVPTLWADNYLQKGAGD